jgi:hypothetical protein
MIGKKLRSPLRDDLRLILHILPAAGNEQQHCKPNQHSRVPQSLP